MRTPTIVAGENGTEWHFGQINLPPVILVVLCGILLTRGAKESATFNAIMVIIKLGILALFVAVSFSGFEPANFTPFFNTDNSQGWAGMAGVSASAGIVFFFFIGLDTLVTAGAEVKDPKRMVPRGLIIAVLIVTAFYLLVAIAAAGAQPASMFAGQEAGLAVIMQNVPDNEWPSLVLSAGAVISVFSVTLVTIYGQTRILFAVSRDRLISPSFQKMHAKTRTPNINTLIVCVLVAVVAGTVDSGFLWDMASMGTLVAFSIVSAAVPVMRHREGLCKGEGFRVPFGPYAIPGLSILACLYILKDLPLTTYYIFAIWLGVALLTYFTYGVHNSKLHLSTH